MAEEQKINILEILSSLRWFGMVLLFLFHFYFQVIQNDERHDQQYQLLQSEIKELIAHKNSDHGEIRGEIRALQVQLNDLAMRGKK